MDTCGLARYSVRIGHGYLYLLASLLEMLDQKSIVAIEIDVQANIVCIAMSKGLYEKAAQPLLAAGREGM